MKGLENGTLVVSLVLIAIAILNLVEYNKNKDKYRVVLMENIILHDYKRAYLELLEKCDTIHQHCFNTNISSMKISSVHTITSCNSQTVFCSSCGNNTISTNVGGMLTKADAG